MKQTRRVGREKVRGTEGGETVIKTFYEKNLFLIAGGKVIKSGNSYRRIVEG